MQEQRTQLCGCVQSRVAIVGDYLFIRTKMSTYLGRIKRPRLTARKLARARTYVSHCMAQALPNDTKRRGKAEKYKHELQWVDELSQ